MRQKKKGSIIFHRQLPMSNSSFLSGNRQCLSSVFKDEIAKVRFPMWQSPVSNSSFPGRDCHCLIPFFYGAIASVQVQLLKRQAAMSMFSFARGNCQFLSSFYQRAVAVQFPKKNLPKFRFPRGNRRCLMLVSQVAIASVSFQFPKGPLPLSN